MFSRHQVESSPTSSTSSLQPWLFQVQPYPGESFGHFLGRFRRANHLSSAHLSAMLKQRPYTVSYWETPSRRRQPDASALQHLSQLTGVAEERFSTLRLPSSTQLHKPTRLCADCYTELPYHKWSWQVMTQPHCKTHQRPLLGACPRCGSAFRLPSYWQMGECDYCHLPFRAMRTDRES